MFRLASIWSATVILALLLTGICSTAAGAQTLDEILPAGMTLDESGQLQWTDFEASVCTSCAGTGLTACPLCERESRACGTCDDGEVRCADCAGMGQTLDPFVEVLCTYCEGSGRKPCSVCSATGVLTTKSGEETTCPVCAGSGAFECPLCAGTGRLGSLRTAGGDLRQGTLEELLVLDHGLGALATAWATRHGEQRSADARLEKLAERLPAARSLLPLPAGQLERLKAIVEGYTATDDGAMRAQFVVSFFETGVSSYFLRQQQALQRCVWRLRKNAGAFDVEGPQKKASRLQWFGAMGGDPSEPADVYCLLGQGFLRTPSAENTEAVIADWLSSHPDAVLRVVARLENFMGSDPESQFMHVWVVNGEENLNLYLVERGCVPAGTMQAARPEIEIPFEDYLDFLHAVEQAEGAAKEAKLGLFGEAKTLQKNHAEAAQELMRKGQHAEALVEFLAANELGGASAFRWVDIAKCYEELEQWESALDAYDQAIGDGHWWPPYTLKAHCLLRSAGLEEAVAWLEKLAAAEPEARKFPHILGTFLLEAGETHRAIGPLQHAVDLACAQQHFAFDDDGWLILDEETLAKENNDYAELWPTLESLARALFLDGKPDAARIRATMGIAMGQQLKRCKGYYNETEVEAGDVACRLLRARVFLKHREWVDAERDLRLARALAKRSGTKPWLDEIADLEKWLEANRDD